MGVDYHTYIGPYIQVHDPKMETTKKEQRCPNPDCSNHKRHTDSQFCAKCGTKIRHIDVPCKKQKDFDIYDEFNERLSDVGSNYGELVNDYHFFISNIRGVAGINLDSENNGVTPIGAPQIQKDLQAMNEKFAEEIARLKEVYGNDAVKVEWGLIQYAT